MNSVNFKKPHLEQHGGTHQSDIKSSRSNWRLLQGAFHSVLFFFTPVALTKNRGSLRLVPPPATTTAHSNITVPPSGLTSSTLRTGRPQHQEERGGGSGHTSDSRCSSTRGCSLIAPPKKKGRLKVQAGLDAALRAPSPFAPTSSKPQSEGCHEVGAPSCCWHRPGAAGSSPPQ